LFGATGLVGGALLELLLEDPDHDVIRVVGRRSIGRSHPRLEEQVIDLSDPEAMQKSMKGASVVFVAIGTTMRKVKGDRDLYKTKLKGVTEETVMEQGVPLTIIVRPSLLMGKRAEHRPAERIAQWVWPKVDPFLLGSWRRYRGISAVDVARAMIQSVKTEERGVLILEYDQMMARSKALNI